MHAATAISEVRCDLGEGPHWNHVTRRLTWVDINAGAIHTFDPSTGEHTAIGLAPPVSFAISVADSTELVCGTGGELTLYNPSVGVIGRFVVETGRPDNRFNDAKADPAGRLWFGSMSLTRTPGDATFYRLDEEGLTVIDEAVTVSNGLDWDVERGRMYYIDSPRQQIDVFTYDVATGSVDDRRPFVSVDPADGLPDGLTLDADGCVWVALFQGGVLRRYSPDAELIDVIRLPLTCPTCPVFGGDDLRTMYVTTSRHKLDDEQRAAQPLAGAVLQVDAGVTGRRGNQVSPLVADALRPDRSAQP